MEGSEATTARSLFTLPDLNEVQRAIRITEAFFELGFVHHSL